MNENNVIRPVNGEPLMSKYLNGRGIELGLPVSGTFELTSRCNFDCRMCYVHNSNSAELEKKELDADTWLSIASDARDMGLMFLLLTGGEPFLRRDFPYIYTELVKMGLLVSINTNASLYSPELRELFNGYPPSRINVTLYGGSEETYRSLCGNASFGKVQENLVSMKNDGLQVRLNVSLTPFNVGDMEKIDVISREIGLQAKASAYMYPPVRIGGEVGHNCARFAPEDAGEAIARWNFLRDTEEITRRKAELITQNKNAELNDSCTDPEQEGVSCRAGRSSFWMTWDGRMLPCGTMDVESAFPLKDGFAAAWEEVRRRTAEIRLPVECSACPHRVNCSVCASSCKGETGRFDGRPEYICRMMKSMRASTVRFADGLGGKDEDKA